MRDLVQALNPRSKRYVLIDREAGMIVKHKATKGPYKNIPIAVRRTPEEDREHWTRLRQDMECKRDEQHFVTVDPGMCFGAPQVYGIPTEVVAGRYNAGDNDIDELAEDLNLTVWQVYIALAYERCVVDRKAEVVPPDELG